MNNTEENDMLEKNATFLMTKTLDITETVGDSQIND